MSAVSFMELERNLEIVWKCFEVFSKNNFLEHRLRNSYF